MNLMNRPVVNLAPVIDTLIFPLKKFGITYFSYAKIEKNTLAGFQIGEKISDLNLKSILVARLSADELWTPAK